MRKQFLSSITVQKGLVKAFTFDGVAFADMAGDLSMMVGPKGDKGDTGNTGSAGSAATISVGTVTTGSPGSSATVTNAGTSAAAVLNFARHICRQ